MGSLSDFSESALMNHVFSSSAYTPAATVYLALCTADPTDAGTGASMNEVGNSNNYTRKAITFGAASARRVTQSADVEFDQASGSWGTVTHYAIVDSATHGAGNMLAHGALSTSKSIVNGNTPTVPSGEVYVEIGGAFSVYLANGLLDRMFRNQAFTKPDTFVALTTATVDEDDTGSTLTEPSGNGYARIEVDVNGGDAPTWSTISGGALSNTHAVEFGPASGSWGTITSVAVVTASSAGQVLMFSNDLADQAVTTDDTVVFDVGDLDLVLT